MSLCCVSISEFVLITRTETLAISTSNLLRTRQYYRSICISQDTLCENVSPCCLNEVETRLLPQRLYPALESVTMEN